MEKKTVLVLFPCAPEEREILIRQTGERCHILFREEDWTVEQYRQALGDAHVILGEPRNEDFPFCTRLELMHSPCSGVNYYVQGGTFPRDAIFCCMTGGYGNIIAEHMLAMTLSLCRRLPEYRDQQREHKWQLRKYDKQLEGSTVLILGAGDIGTNAARLFKMMDCRITGVRRVVRDVPKEFDAMITLEQVDTVLPEADIVICCMPHTPLTQGFFTKARFEKMKSTAIFVNVGRGTLVDHEALADVLNEGKIFGAALDVTFPEPLPENHPLWKCRNVLITPHVSGQTFAGLKDKENFFFQVCKENLENYRDRNPLQNQVDLKTGYRVTTN